MNKNMTYKETINYLFEALPAYQNQGKSAYKEDLNNTHALMKELGHPYRKFNSIHIAGTNGKGSVSHILAAVFQECGYKTGLYTSPHLLDFRERVRINGKMISQQEVIDFTIKNKAAFERIKPSFFEMTVGLAFHTFAEKEVDIAIIETGLGGRLDSTNVITPIASVITNISMDHADFLGETLEKIACEKAGIIKENTLCIVGEMPPSLMPVFEKEAAQKKAALYRSTEHYSIVTQYTNTPYKRITFNHKGKYFSIETDLIGKYQAQNIATTLCVIDALAQGFEFKLSQTKVVEALKSVSSSTGLQGRWQTLRQKPLWIADTAHNEAGIQILMQQITELPHQRKFIIYGCVADKRVETIFKLFNTDFHYIFTQSRNKRSLHESKLLPQGKQQGLSCQSAGNIEKAVNIAQKSSSDKDAVIICGSTFLVAEALALKEW